MKKDRTMIKNSFLNGAFITTLGIIITKILGIIYVIPFHSIIGESGGALYGYAYTVYLLFMSLSSAGIPMAISRIVSEYQTLGYYNAKKRTFILGKKIALILGFICFLILIIFAPIIARSILGELTGGNTIEDIVFVIRVISIAILIVPVLSIYRGYFEGHRFMSPPSISQIVEQAVRILIIVFGSFLALNVFKMSLTFTVSIALFGATVGALVSCLYLIIKKRQNNRKFNEKIRQVNEPIVTDKQIVKKIISYALPFIMIDLFRTFYNYIDMTTVVKGLVNNANFSVADAEIIMSMISTWANKFNMIVFSISTGIVVSLIPNLTQSVVTKKKNDIDKKVCQALNCLLYFTIPMTIGISFLSKAIWTLFYGNSLYGSSVLSFYIFSGMVIGLFTLIISILQVFKDYKFILFSLIFGILLKIVLNTNLISAFYKMGVPAYYGVITATIIGYLFSIFICFFVLSFKYKINFESVIHNIVDIIIGTFFMTILLFILKLIFPVSSDTRIINLFIILFYSLVGSFSYFVFSYRCGLIRRIFGNRFNFKKNNG